MCLDWPSEIPDYTVSECATCLKYPPKAGYALVFLLVLSCQITFWRFASVT